MRLFFCLNFFIDRFCDANKQVKQTNNATNANAANNANVSDQDVVVFLRLKIRSFLL